MQLGRCIDGRELSYDARLYEFRLARELVTFDDVRDLDAHAHIHWRAPEQRDWFRRINGDDLRACNNRALSRLGGDYYAGMSPEERVQADAARDDSVLAGKIVDADPVLVQAVAAQLEAQGFFAQAPTAQAGFNPLAAANLPKGMEALSQMERHHGSDRKMTSAEKRLMKKILKNDDKEKARREKQQARSAGEAQEEEAAANAQDARDAGKASSLQSRAVSDAMTVVAASPQHHRFPEIGYTDSNGNPIRPEADAVRPDMEQLATAVSEEERALNAMREKNRAAGGEQYATDVPGMEKKRGQRKPLAARINGVSVNPDGSPKDTRFKKFLGGLGEVVDVVAPLAGGGRGGGGGGQGGMGGPGGSGGPGGMGGR